MTYTLIFTATFQKDIKRLHKKIPHRAKEILELAENVISKDPRGSGIKKLQCFELYRCRVGEYRVVFDIVDNVHEVHFLIIEHRPTVYKRLKKMLGRC
ncbi:type II toxin-antitoxin system RelE/ParE family toxin [Methanococcoides sp. SA1]|nr:type II toxin-antitoxin system RelE/ParE family toxin [Methanococcoides sp. SA1]